MSQFIYWDSTLLASVVCFDELVYASFRKSNMHGILEFCLDQSGRNIMYQRVGKSLLSEYIYCVGSVTHKPQVTTRDFTHNFKIEKCIDFCA